MITSIEIHGVRSLSAAELRFGPGLNLVTGPSGSGKTTVLDAIAAAAAGKDEAPHPATGDLPAPGSGDGTIRATLAAGTPDASTEPVKWNGTSGGVNAGCGVLL